MLLPVFGLASRTPLRSVMTGSSWRRANAAMVSAISGPSSGTSGDGQLRTDGIEPPVGATSDGSERFGWPKWPTGDVPNRQVARNGTATTVEVTRCRGCADDGCGD